MNNSDIQNDVNQHGLSKVLNDFKRQANLEDTSTGASTRVNIETLPRKLNQLEVSFSCITQQRNTLAVPFSTVQPTQSAVQLTKATSPQVVAATDEVRETRDQLVLSGLHLLIMRLVSEVTSGKVLNEKYDLINSHVEQLKENHNCTSKLLKVLLEVIKDLSFFREQRLGSTELNSERAVTLSTFEEFITSNLEVITVSASDNQEVYEDEIKTGSVRSLVRYLEQAPEVYHGYIAHCLIQLNFGMFKKTIAKQLRLELYLYREGARSSHGMFTVLKLTLTFVMRTPEIYKKSFLKLHRRPEGIISWLMLLTIDRVRGDVHLIIMTVNTVVNEIGRPSNFIDCESIHRVLDAYFEEIAELLELLTLEEVRKNSRKIFTSLRVLWNSPGSYRAFKCLSLFQRPRLFSLLREEINNGEAPDLKPVLYKFMRDFPTKDFCLRRVCHIVHELLYLHGLTDGERDEYMNIYVRELQMAMTLKETKNRNYTRKASMLEFLLHDEFRATFLPMVIDKYDGFLQVLEEVRYSASFSSHSETVKQNLILNLGEEQLQQMIVNHESISATCGKIINYFK